MHSEAWRKHSWYEHHNSASTPAENTAGIVKWEELTARRYIADISGALGLYLSRQRKFYANVW